MIFAQFNKQAKLAIFIILMLVIALASIFTTASIKGMLNQSDDDIPLNTDVREIYLNQNSLYGTKISNVQFQSKAEKSSSSQCSAVKGGIVPSKAQKRGLLERNVTPQIATQKTISHTQFQSKVSKDIKLKNITDYANKIGYIPFKNGTQEITYDNGIKAIIAPMQLKNKSIENKAVYIASFSQNGSSNFSFIAKIQNENGTPTITMFSEEGGVVIDLMNGAIIREWGHHSCSYWQCIGHCAYYWIFIGNLGYFCKAACTACYGLPGPWTCGPCIACLIVFAADCGVNCYSDNCYWYPCQKDCSDENYCESFVYYCSGNDRRKHHLCHNLECNNPIPGESGGCVDKSGSPSWQDDTFVEICTYGCNEATGNCQGAITCYGDGDCGDSGWIGSPSCSGGDVWQTWREHTCYNSGTESSYCDYDDDSILKQECTSGECSGGECVASESCEEYPGYPWYCNEQCWHCDDGDDVFSICCPDSGNPDWCCNNSGPYCDTTTGECDVCGGDYPYECDTSTYDCWGCFQGGELCCAEEYGDRDPENMLCCYTEIGAVCLSNGSCCLPYNETCNNLDDDCDGTIDSFSEGCGVGACAVGTRTCTSGSWGSCSTAGLATDETCNNIDDDCDGSVDESLSQECGTDVGACVKGTQTCSTGNWSACGGSYVGPTDETCNDIDDNCNNITDEQNVCNNSIVINLEFPKNNTVEYSNSTPTFGFNITNVNYTSFNCTLWLDNGTPLTYGNDSIWIHVGTSWNLTANRTVSDDTYYWWINCTDGVNLNISEKRIITVGLKQDGQSCTQDSECTSNNCVTAINSGSKYCAASGKECSRSGYDPGYDTGDEYGAYICKGDDLGGQECNSGNACHEYGSKYCDGVNDWVTDNGGDSQGQDANCNACVVCSSGTGDTPSCSSNIADHNQDTTGSNQCTATCKECDGAGNCANQAADDDYFSHCGLVECDDGASPSYYYGWSILTCYYRQDEADGACDGSSACKTASDYCPSNPQDGSSGVTCDCDAAEIGCSGTTIGSCDNELCIPPNVTLNKPQDNSIIATSDMPITLNFSVTSQSGLKNCSLWGDFSGSWGLNQTIRETWCYQETANVSTACGGLAAGSYSWYSGADNFWRDGSWNDSYTLVSTSDYLYVNYTIPLAANNNSLFQSKHYTWQSSYTTANGTIPKSCWNYSKGNSLPLQILVRQINGGRCGPAGQYCIYIDCYNGSSWENKVSSSGSVSSSAHFNKIYEEAMWWDFVGVQNNTITDFDPITLSSGDYIWNAQCYGDNGLSDWGDDNFTIGVEEPNKIYTIRNSSNNNVAYFDNGGNLILLGNCTSGGACSGSDGDFIFKDSGGNEVAHIDNSGNLCIETGDCSDNNASCNPSNSAFIVQDSLGNNVSYIDLTNGDLCLTGDLVEDGSP